MYLGSCDIGLALGRELHLRRAGGRSRHEEHDAPKHRHRHPQTRWTLTLDPAGCCAFDHHHCSILWRLREWHGQP
jgi:hypothetical protein